MAEHPIRRALTALGTFTAHPAAFGLVVLFGVGWWLLDRPSLDGHGIATLLTLFMTLMIQRAEHRDTQAIHAKLDELIHASTHARDAITHIDEKEPESIERFREAHRDAD